MKWLVKEKISEEFENAFPELPYIVKQLLYNRNLKTQKDIDEFLNPDYLEDIHDPFLFRDMKKAVDRIFSAISKNETIMIHGDYDADGVCASVILTTVIRALGGKTDIFLPHRETDGYGINEKTVKIFAERGLKLVITCDCGISNIKEIELANSFGIDVIITDHHAEQQTLPPAFAIIHPKVEGETYPDKTLAGGGVAFKLAQGLLKQHKENGGSLASAFSHDAFEKWLLDMVAISSVADMVPLLYETRTLVKYGLVVLNKTRRPGLKKLIQIAGLGGGAHNNNNYGNGGAPQRKTKISTNEIAFRLAPRINAAGRMNHANVAFNLLICEDAEEAEKLASELQGNNAERQALTEKLVQEAKEQIKNTGQTNEQIILIEGEGWTAGIIGLIASKIKDVYGRPVIVMGINNGQVVGSGRSIPQFNMIEALQTMPQFFYKFGGHPQACGFSLTGVQVLQNFKTAIKDEAKKFLANVDLTPTIAIDAEVNLDNINWNLFEVLEKFEPFGVANPEPRYLAKNLIVHSAEPVGANGSHMRLNVTHLTSQIRKTIGFFCGDWCQKLKQGDKINLVFEVGMNEWNGTRELQLKIVDLRTQESTPTFSEDG